VKEKSVSQVETLAELFGGKGKLAEAAGTDRSMVTRWDKPYDWREGGHVGNGGHVPTRHNRAIVGAAMEHAARLPDEEAKAFMDAVSACLDPAVCPTCGQSVDDGRVL
jgi:hypothetical protein